MNYRVWSVLGAKPCTKATFHDRSVIRGLKLTLGKPLRERWPRVDLRVTSKAAPADTFKVGVMRVVSRPLANTISELVSAKDIELLPVHVNYKGDAYGEYFFLNIMKRIDAIDREHSVYTFDDDDSDTIDEVTSLVLKENEIDDAELFQLACWSPILCVSARLADAITARKHSGLKLYSPTDWRPY